MGGAQVRVVVSLTRPRVRALPHPQSHIRQLLPGCDDEQAKLQILVMELKDEKREGESEEQQQARALAEMESAAKEAEETNENGSTHKASSTVTQNEVVSMAHRSRNRTPEDDIGQVILKCATGHCMMETPIPPWCSR